MSITQIVANRFEISDLEKDLLGRGGMGNVYRGTDTQTGQTVAIKALKPDIVARFIREGEVLRQLNHPSIVTMVTAVEEDGQHYLIMEYVAGGSLQNVLEAGGPLPIERALEIALDLADALTRAHRLGIIHRDLKPANVLLAEDGTPRLTDFGLAHVAGSSGLTQAGILVGTVGYLSPEVCSGETLDNRADIWVVFIEPSRRTSLPATRLDTFKWREDQGSRRETQYRVGVIRAEELHHVYMRRGQEGVPFMFAGP